MFDAKKSYGYIWWTADSMEEVAKWQSEIEPKGAKVVRLKQDDEGTVRFIFVVNKENVEQVLGYQPGDEEWLVLSPFAATIKVFGGNKEPEHLIKVTLAGLNKETAWHVLREYVKRKFGMENAELDGSTTIEVTELPDVDLYESVVTETQSVTP